MNGRRKPYRKQQRRRTLRIESLESRRLLATFTCGSIQVIGNSASSAWQIEGTGNSDYIVVTSRLNETDQLLEVIATIQDRQRVACNSHTQFYATFEGFTPPTLEINSHGEDDTIINSTNFASKIDGGAGPDTIFGGTGDDVIVGGDGHDTIDGGAGDDTINGGKGNDTIFGGFGDDEIFGGRGRDVIDGEAGEDTIIGGLGDDELSGGSGNDVIRGGNGHDIIEGNQGNDILSGENGNDKIWGGQGNDRLYGGNGDDYLDEGIGNGSLFGGYGQDELQGGPGADRFLSSEPGGISAAADDIWGTVEDQDAVVWFNAGRTHKSRFGGKVTAGTWEYADVERMDDAFETLVSLTDSTALLKKTNGNSITFKRYSDMEVVRAWNSGAAIHLGDGHFTTRTQQDLYETIWHEIGHYWQNYQPFRGQFQAVRRAEPDAVIQEYSKTNRREDFATTFAAFVSIARFGSYSSDGSIDSGQVVYARAGSRLQVIDDLFASF